MNHNEGGLEPVQWVFDVFTPNMPQANMQFQANSYHMFMYVFSYSDVGINPNDYALINNTLRIFPVGITFPVTPIVFPTLPGQIDTTIYNVQFRSGAAPDEAHMYLFVARLQPRLLSKKQNILKH
jgi:hypothetical protein